MIGSRRNLWALMVGLMFYLHALGAHELPLMFQERHLSAQVGSFEHLSFPLDEAHGIRIGYSIFNGDFPILLHAEASELSLYTGSPLFIPGFISVGSTTQAGYIDAYRIHTPIASLSAGYRFDLLGMDRMINEGPFIAWGWRSGFISGGISYHIASREPVGYIGTSFDQLGITMSLSREFLDAQVTLRSDSTWSLSISFGVDDQLHPSMAFGFGFSRKDYPSDAMLRDRFDMAVAHRGTLQEAPENSHEAITHALSQPQYVAIETDIQMTADGTFVLIHDPILLRYRHGFARVEELTSEELMLLDMGSWFDNDFSGTRILEISDLAKLSNRNPDIHWLLELKDPLWSEDDARRFLKEVESLFEYPQTIAFYVVTHEMLELMQRLSGRPVGIQLDTVKGMLFYSDHLLPLMKAEYRSQVEGADFFTILSSKYDRKELLLELSDELSMPVMFWNFHDDIIGYIPSSLESFPLGMPKMPDGTVLR